MRQHRRGVCLGLIALVAACAATAPALAQATSVDQEIEAGRKAAAQGQLGEATRLFALAVADAEKSGRTDARLGTSLTELGLAYTAQRKFDEAEPILQRAAAVKERVLGPDHPDLARALVDLGTLYRMENQHAKAEVVVRRAVSILEKALGPEHPEVAGQLTDLGGRLRDQGKYAEAEPILKRALAIREKILRPDDPYLVRTLIGLGNLYADQNKYADAEPLFRRAVSVLDSIKAYGTEYPNLPDTLRVYANLLRKTGRVAEAEQMEARADAIRPPDAPRRGAR